MTKTTVLPDGRVNVNKTLLETNDTKVYWVNRLPKEYHSDSVGNVSIEYHSENGHVHYMTIAILPDGLAIDTEHIPAVSKEYNLVTIKIPYLERG